jgi:hypothetical protein
LALPLLGTLVLLGTVVPWPLPLLLTAAGVRSMSAVGGSAMPCGLVSEGFRANVAAALWLPEAVYSIAYPVWRGESENLLFG